MKIKCLVRNPDDYLRETKQDIHKMPRNYDPDLHPFEAAREYTRALNSVKLERVFAKPFIKSLDGHRDGISCMVPNPTSLSSILSGSYDGEVKIWDLPHARCVRTVQTHTGFVRGIALTPDGSSFYTAGDDKNIHRWSMSPPKPGEDEEAQQTIISKHVLTGIAHHQTDNVYATCGEYCDIYDVSRATPVRSFQWGVDTMHHIAFNPIETSVLATCASDRSIILYDSRETEPLKRIIMNLKTNQIAWNPMEAYIFTVANEDHNLYTFDMRNLRNPINLHKDHIAAVTSVAYAPTGREVVSGSYDKTVRIFKMDEGHSRDIYHTKRMQRVRCIAWTLDNKFVLSGSDEMNIRVWKARSNEKLGVVTRREKAARLYGDKLKEKFQAHPEVKRIARHRHVPKTIFKNRKHINVQERSIKRKESNRRAHSKPGSVPHKPERQKHVVKEEQ